MNCHAKNRILNFLFRQPKRIFNNCTKESLRNLSRKRETRLNGHSCRKKDKRLFNIVAACIDFNIKQDSITFMCVCVCVSDQEGMQDAPN